MIGCLLLAFCGGLVGLLVAGAGALGYQRGRHRGALLARRLVRPWAGETPRAPGDPGRTPGEPPGCTGVAGRCACICPFHRSSTSSTRKDS